MPVNRSALLDDVQPKMLRLGSETDLKALQEAGRRSQGRILERAIQIAGYTKGQACHELAVPGEPDLSPSQLSAWMGGTENAQTWRFEQHMRLGPALLVARGEALDDLVDVRTVITIKQRLGGPV